MSLFSDFSYALRTLGRSPVFTVVAVLSLALGIGANAAIFSLMDQAMLRFLPAGSRCKDRRDANQRNARP